MSQPVHFYTITYFIARYFKTFSYIIRVDFSCTCSCKVYSYLKIKACPRKGRTKKLMINMVLHKVYFKQVVYISKGPFILHNCIATHVMLLHCAVSHEINLFLLEMRRCCGGLRQRCYRCIGTAMQLRCSMNGP